MTLLNFDNCDFDCALALDSKHRLNDAFCGEYGFDIFYNVNEGETFFSSFFKDLPDNFCGGQLEFTIDENNNVSEVLLWYSIDEDDGIINDDYIEYDSDISVFVNDFIVNQLPKIKNEYDRE